MKSSLDRGFIYIEDKISGTSFNPRVFSAHSDKQRSTAWKKNSDCDLLGEELPILTTEYEATWMLYLLQEDEVKPYQPH